jgi:hypothetical protein
MNMRGKANKPQHANMIDNSNMPYFTHVLFCSKTNYGFGGYKPI